MSSDEIVISMSSFVHIFITNKLSHHLSVHKISYLHYLGAIFWTIHEVDANIFEVDLASITVFIWSLWKVTLAS